MKNISILLASSVLFISCEKIIEPKDLPQQDLRLVLNTVIQNDSVFNAYLSSSKSIISGKEYKTIDKAYCAVYEDGVFFEQLAFNTKGIYVGTKKPLAGKKYEFVARAAGFEEVKGTTETPVLPNIISAVAYDTVQTFFAGAGPKGKPFENVSGGMKFKIALKERSGLPDYFLVTPFLLLIDSAGNPLNTLPGTLTDNSNSGGTVSSGFYTSDGFAGSDAEGVIAGEKVFDFFIGSFSDLKDYPTAAGVSIFLIVSNLSADYFKYLETVYQQAGTSGSFFAEPTFVYSNCSNGMGIVGAKFSKYHLVKSVLFKR